MNFNKKDIEALRYDKNLWKLFPQISEYQALMDDFLIANSLSSEQVKRYAVVGLLGEYHATNHHGEEFTTDPKQWSGLVKRTKTKAALDFFNTINGRFVTTTSEYLELFSGKKPLQMSGRALFDFVIAGSDV